MVNTARLGVAKPDPRVYRIAAQRVQAARNAGMTGLHYHRLDELRRTVAPCSTRRRF
ncbi:hypothetical protein ACWD3Z_00660 [Streptomyces sp. NPDC002740]